MSTQTKLVAVLIFCILLVAISMGMPATTGIDATDSPYKLTQAPHGTLNKAQIVAHKRRAKYNARASKKGGKGKDCPFDDCKKPVVLCGTCENGGQACGDSQTCTIVMSEEACKIAGFTNGQKLSPSKIEDKAEKVKDRNLGCLIEHELEHTKQDPCSTKLCEGEKKGYDVQASCLKDSLGSSCKNKKSESCQQAKAAICDAKAHAALTACQLSKDKKSCDHCGGCEEKAQSAYQSCLSKSGLDPSRFNSSFVKPNCLYCSLSCPTCPATDPFYQKNCVPTPTPTAQNTPTATATAVVPTATATATATVVAPTPTVEVTNYTNRHKGSCNITYTSESLNPDQVMYGGIETSWNVAQNEKGQWIGRLNHKIFVEDGGTPYDVRTSEVICTINGCTESTTSFGRCSREYPEPDCSSGVITGRTGPVPIGGPNFADYEGVCGSWWEMIGYSFFRGESWDRLVCGDVTPFTRVPQRTCTADGKGFTHKQKDSYSFECPWRDTSWGGKAREDGKGSIDIEIEGCPVLGDPG